MHAKKKGNIGQLATASCLTRFGYSVFIEAGDISKIDLIAERNGKLATFQCKAITPEHGKLRLHLQKSGPGGYNKKYEQGQFDFFSAYDLINNKLYIVPSSILAERENSFHLRIVKPRNNQHKGIHYAVDYLAETVLLTELNPCMTIRGITENEPSKLMPVKLNSR